MSLNFKIRPLPSWQLDHYRILFLKESDAAKLADYYLRNRFYLKPWDPTRPENYFTIEGWKKRIQSYMLMIKQNQLFSFVIYEDDKIIGVINYSHVKPFPLHSCSIGYSLDQHKQGEGIMTRSLIILNRWVFQQNIHRINASFMPRNDKSRAVLIKLGFELEGLAKQYLIIDGVWEDHYLAALINPNR